MPPITVRAPAKINLTLHVTGQRADGYHLLDSLVVFADLGDTVIAHPADTLSLSVTGPEAGDLAGEGDNLVLRAARLFGSGRGARLELVKRLPVASGLGGGSSDAAATLLALSRLWRCPLPAEPQVLSLGADVPVCLHRAPARMQGIGEDVTPVPPLPDNIGVVLVNPRVPVATPQVFKALACKDNPPMPPVPTFRNAVEFAQWLAGQRNDLQAPAITLAPEISSVLEALQANAPLMARMSGSGATCFALCATQDEAKATGAVLAEQNPDWWVTSGGILS